MEEKELKSDEVPFSIQPGKVITKISDCTKLGVIFVGTSDEEIFVIDPTLGEILYHTSFQSESPSPDNETAVVDSSFTTPSNSSSSKHSKNDWDFSIGPEKVIVVHNNKVGIRSEYKGIVLLSTILQTPLKNSSETCKIELNITEAESLCHSLAAVDVSNEPDTLEVEKQLKAVVKESSDVGSFVKKEKWTTVKLELPHSVLKSTFQSMVTELWKKNAYIPQLSTASSILERLNMLIPPGKIDLDRDAIDKTQMFSESARLSTFANWPHTDYKWASPSKMAQAGFYHHPSAHGEDRALCFTCHVCLVSWEPTDEPWSEHERHSPFCPFVRGEHTHNVPLSLSYATAPAFTLKKSKNIGTPILGKSSFSSVDVVAYSLGLVVVWDVAKQAKEAVQFEVTYKDVESLDPLASTYSDIDLKPKEAWIMDISDPTKSIIPPETSINIAETSDYRIVLTSVAILGAPSSSSKRESKKSSIATTPPSVIVGGTIYKHDRSESGSSGSETKIPVILVYGLSGTEITDESRDISASEIFKAIGNTGTSGTKQEAQLSQVDGDEELFISYMSESDMSLFSDITESSGTFILDQNPMSVSMSNASAGGAAPHSKKKATLPPKKAESSVSGGKSNRGSRAYLKPGPNVLIAQKINLPFDLNHCYVVKDMLPSGSQLVVFVESGDIISNNTTLDNNDGRPEEMIDTSIMDESLSTFGAILVYSVNVRPDTCTNNISTTTAGVNSNFGVVSLNSKNPMIRKIDDRNDLIVNTCVIPPEVTDEPLLACVLKRGDVAILNLNDLVVIHRILRPSPDAFITSVSYCASLERLCCGTNTGNIELFVLNGQGDSSETDSVVEDNKPSIEELPRDGGLIEAEVKSNSGSSTTTKKKHPSSPSSSKLSTAPTAGSPNYQDSAPSKSLISSRPLILSSLKQLLKLTEFENLKPCFTANVPDFYGQPILQAQKERKHPQHLQAHAHDNDLSSNGTSTKSWRLQRNKNSKKEHLIELSLPQSVHVGHLDFKFVLQMGCTSLPVIEVTLYKATKLKARGDSHDSNVDKSIVDKCIDFNQLKLNKNPSNEFLKSINAEVVCGPLELAANVDLSAQGGTIIFTSPALMLAKGRNFYLHIRAKSTGKAHDSSNSSSNNIKSKLKDGSSSSSSSKSKVSAFSKFSKGYKEYKSTDDPSIFLGSGQNPFMSHTIHKMSDSPIITETEKKKEYGGCDWIHEVSITVKINKKSSIPHEEQERKLMLTSPSFFSKLLSLAVFEGESQEEKVLHLQTQSAALDLLVWVAAINLCGPPTSKYNYQLAFIQTIQTKLQELILHGILFADRSISHKTAKLLVLCIDSVENYYSKDDREPFLSTLLQCLLTLLPFTISCVSAGSLQWFFLILNRVRTTNLSLASESLLGLLNDVSEELQKRNDPYHALLRTRFGLYGTVFDSEIFEIELPAVTKSYSHPLTYGGMCGVDSQNGSTANGTLHFLGLKDVDFRDLLAGNPMRLGKVGGLSPKQQIQGLLEVEPLHFTCHACSDGLRMEKIETGVNTTSFTSAVPFAQSSFMDHTNNPTYMHTGEGSKKSSETDKHDQIMMLQKALKMDTTHDLGWAYDVGISDIMSNAVGNSSQIPNIWDAHTTAHANISDLGELGYLSTANTLKNVGVLTMAVGNSNLTLTQQNPSSYQGATYQGASGVGGNAKKIYGHHSLHSGNSVDPQADALFSPSIFSMYPYVKPKTGGSSAAAVSDIKKKYSSSNNPGSSNFGAIPTFTASQSSATSSANGGGSSSSHPPKQAQQQQQGPSSSSSSSKEESKVTTPDDNLRLLLSPFQQMLFHPPQQAIVIDRLHSGARRFIVLDFGSPVLLTDLFFPSCNDLVSLAIDIWLHREEVDGQRLIVASDIGLRSLVICDLQPPPIVRYLKITTIGRYGMGGVTRCRIPLGMFFGHTVVLPGDVAQQDNSNLPADVNVLNPALISSHLAVLSSLVEDIGCRYQLACTKLRRFLEPLLKPEISALDHISYYLPKGKERNKLGLNTTSDHGILNAYQECMTLQQQLNVAKNVVKRLQKSLAPYPILNFSNAPRELLSEVCTNKIHMISEFVIESLLGISFIATSTSSISLPPPYPLYFLSFESCLSLFKNVCVLENGQCQLSTCTLLLRVAGFQPWWGKFIASTLKDLFSSSNNGIFPKDRVFILLVYLGQKALLNGQNASVLEDVMKLLEELLAPIETQKSDFFLRSKIDMTLLGWCVLLLCYLLDGVSGISNCEESNSSTSIRKKDNKDSSSPKESAGPSSSRWDFIQGESALLYNRRMNGPSKSTSVGTFKRRLQKKIMATKQKLEELDSVAGFGYTSQLNQSVGGLGNQLSALGNKLEAIKQKQASIGKNIKLQSSKHFKDLLQIRRTEMLYKKGFLGKEGSKDGEILTSDIEVNLNLSPLVCLSVAKSLGALLLRMDSTCHSDLFLISLKALAKISTSCRPAIPLSAIFNQNQLTGLILTAVGNDYLQQKNWSASWVSHAVQCMIKDITEQEKVYPRRKDSSNNIDGEQNKQSRPQEQQQISTSPPFANAGVNEETTNNDVIITEADVQNQSQNSVEDMNIDEMSDFPDASQDLGGLSMDLSMEPTGESEDSDFDDILSDSYSFTSPQSQQSGSGAVGGGSSSCKRPHHSSLNKKLSPCVTSISTALDSRLENGVLASTELRLRMMAVADSDVLTNSLSNPWEVPVEISKTINQSSKSQSQKSSSTPPSESVDFSKTDDSSLLARCFDHIFGLTSSSAVSIERVLQLWLSVNGSDTLPPATASLEDIPAIPLSQKSVNHLMQAFSKDREPTVQEWAQAFQCLTLVANQRRENVNTFGCEQADWLYILRDKNFPEMILRFISSSGINYQKQHLVSVGPTCCQQFYNFLLRIRELSIGTPWTACLKEILLRVLCSFLAGPFLSQDFPLDAFNTYLHHVERVLFNSRTETKAGNSKTIDLEDHLDLHPDYLHLGYETPVTVINIIHQFAKILHLFVFFPNKITIAESKSAAGVGSLSASTPTTSSATNNDGKFGKAQNFEQVVFRLVSLMASLVQLPYGTQGSSDSQVEVESFLREMPTLPRLQSFDEVTLEHLNQAENKTIADIVLRMENTMNRILAVLAYPNGINLINVLVSGDLVSAFKIMESSTPTTVVDAVIHLFSKLSSSASDSTAAVKPIFKFLSKTQYDDFYCPLHVSETFVLLVLKVISKEEHLKEFCKLNCVESICQKLISSTRKFFSSRPTFVSILSTYIGRTDNALFGQKKFGSDIELPDGLINVAPLGTITSTNYSAHPSEVLLSTSTPQHRRSRTPVWSYHFLEDETFLELIIVLPCAISLKEVQIVIQMTTSVSSTNSYIHTSCPSGVQIEVSRDRHGCTIPMGPPIQCHSSSINIQLTQAEVAQKVLLRLFKPKDTNNLGLSQIKLLGTNCFSEAALEGLSSSVDSLKTLESSAHWIYILDKAISVSKSPEIIQRAVNIPDMLESCYSMLLAPVASLKAQEVYLPHVQQVLFQFGSLRRDISEILMGNLLQSVHNSVQGISMVANANSQQVGVVSQLHTVVQLIFKLCCEIPQWGSDVNLVYLFKWLESAADEALAQSNAFSGSSSNLHKKSLPIVVPEYVHCCAAILYHITSIRKVDLSFIITPVLLTKLYNWTKLLDDKSELKKTIDNVILSFCYNKPWMFVYLMYLAEIIRRRPLEWLESNNPMVEDIQTWCDEGCIWDRVEALPLDQLPDLTSGILMTLGRAAQSPSTVVLLQESQFLNHLNASIMSFWTCYTNKWIIAGSSEDHSNQVQTEAEIAGAHVVSVQTVINILTFYEELCQVNAFKNWLGSSGNVFWQPLLNLLSIIPGALKASFFGHTLTYMLESALIRFLAKCVWAHPENQRVLCKCLCDIVVKQKIAPHKAVFLHSMSAFCRRLIIQLLLENERVIVHVKSSSKYPLKNPPNVLPLSSLHPSLGVNGGDRIFYMSCHQYVYELMKCIEPYGVTLEKIVANSDPQRFLSILKKEQGLIEAGLEMIDQMQLSMSGNAAKDKRSQLEAAKRPMKTASKKLKPDSAGISDGNKKDEKIKGPSLVLEAEEFPDIKVPLNLTLATVLAAVKKDRPDTFLDILVFTVRTEVEVPAPAQEGSPVITPSSSNTDILSLRDSAKRKDSIPEVYNVLPLPSTMEVFSRMGGLGLLAKQGLLPVIYPDLLRQITIGSKFTGNVGLVTHHVDKESPVALADESWVKIEADDFYDEMIDSMNMSLATSTPLKKNAVSVRPFNANPGIPPHSMAAFGLFLGLPRFSEVLCQERVGAQCMLRLIMGVSDDAEGRDIFSSPIAKSLPTLPFSILRTLLNLLPVNSEEGSLLRRAMCDIKAIHFILACLAVFSGSCDNSRPWDLGLQHELVIAATKAQGGAYSDRGKSASDDKSHVYWAKGTGFGTGSTTQNWNIEQSLSLKKMEEMNVTNLLDVLSSYIDPRVSSLVPEDTSEALKSQESSSAPSTSSNVNHHLPNEIVDLLKSSSLFPSIASYLRNDSVLDMARHVPLYKSIMLCLRSLVSNPQTAPILLPSEVKVKGSSADEQPLTSLLSKMNEVVCNYSKRLTNSKGKTQKSKTMSKTVEDLEDEGLANLIPDIQLTAVLVQKAVDEMLTKMGPEDVEMRDDNQVERTPVFKSLEDRYLDEMKKLQFAFFDMITEDEETGGIRFTLSYHYEGLVRNSWARNSPQRLKRLAQESVTLSTSLPIAYGSTIFVRCDTDRLDIMKVLITGPAGTPYANGCFEFDVFFPEEYPKTPMMINLETTGRQRVRFNPNLYTDGKVCLSILNTWHGRPEEKWNPTTGSLLPVVVAIQSLILNADPFFNEPGFEKSRGTDAGERNSREYNAGIEIATVEWAMLDQIRHPSPCFKEVIHRHFWLKKGEILAQCEKWLENLIVTCRNDKRAGKHVTGNSDPVGVMRANLQLLKKELEAMKPPSGLEDLATERPTASATEMDSSSTTDTNKHGLEILAQQLLSSSSDTLSTLPGGTMNNDDDDDDENAMLIE